VVNGKVIIPLPETLDDVTAAAIANPAMSSWVALSSRARFVTGERVLILGATGTSGQLAVQIAKRRGAGRIVGAGRSPEALAKLLTLGADAVISLDGSSEEVGARFKQEFDRFMPDVVLDYLWGTSAETVLNAMTAGRHMSGTSRVRYVNIGSTAGPNISLPAAVLRSADIELLGSGFGSASLKQICEAIAEFFVLAAKQPFQFSVRPAPLSEVASLWNEKVRRRASSSSRSC
jgi:NADPH:quinone reductase-like Zn-dependent oxidoreductase